MKNERIEKYAINWGIIIKNKNMVTNTIKILLLKYLNLQDNFIINQKYVIIFSCARWWVKDAYKIGKKIYQRRPNQ